MVDGIRTRKSASHIIILSFNWNVQPVSKLSRNLWDDIQNGSENQNRTLINQERGTSTPSNKTTERAPILSGLSLRAKVREKAADVDGSFNLIIISMCGQTIDRHISHLTVFIDTRNFVPEPAVKTRRKKGQVQFESKILNSHILSCSDTMLTIQSKHSVQIFSSETQTRVDI